MTRRKSLSGAFGSLSRRLPSGGFSSMPPRPGFAHPPARPILPAVFVSGRRGVAAGRPQFGSAAKLIHRHVSVERARFGSVSRALDAVSRRKPPAKG